MNAGGAVGLNRPCTKLLQATAGCSRRQRAHWSLHATPSSSGRQAVHASAADSASQIKPAYNKYKSPSDVQREYLRQWKEITARDGTIQPQTILSTLWFVPVWFKYNATPYILRYLVYCVWMVIKAAHFRWHTAMILQGCKLDAWLAQRGGRQATFSRRLAMERYHFKARRFGTLMYRLRLLFGSQAAVASG